jgi:bifunctional DNA-binding transcriptional regulator/antitoxin component of YhaV-PrlF toxin-antitoxin module
LKVSNRAARWGQCFTRLLFCLGLLTSSACRSKDICVKMTNKGQVTIPPELRKRHGLLPHREVEFVDHPNGVLVVRAAKMARGKRVLVALMRGGKVKGDTASWLRLTRGEE